MSGKTTNKRKLEHIKIVLEKNVEPNLHMFDKYRLPYSALPEIDLEKVDTSIDFLGSQISFPFMISSMTGGPDNGKVINKNIAIAAERMNIPYGVGSMRVIVKHPESASTFDVKEYSPNVKLFANVGLVQLNYGFGIKEIRKIINAVHADGIFFHINPLQEAIQPEGDTNYEGLLLKFEKIIKKIKIPIIVKEVGTGIDVDTARRLKNIGIDWIDVSGHGGTHWGWVEGYRGNINDGNVLKEIGIPTDIAIKTCSNIKGMNIIAGGGIRSGLDIAKSIMLGARLATAAKPLLKPALESPEAVVNILQSYRRQLKIAMFSAGVANIEELSSMDIIEI